jgi:hypothetical protein
MSDSRAMPSPAPPLVREKQRLALLAKGRQDVRRLLPSGQSMFVPTTMMNPGMIATRYGISPDKVLAWIHSGELRAINIAKTRASRPRWVISTDDLAAFERSRECVPHTRHSHHRHCRKEVTEFF